MDGTYCSAGELPELFYLPSESWSSLSKVKMSARLSRVQMPAYLRVSVYSAQRGEGRPDYTLIFPYSMFRVVSPGRGTGCTLRRGVREQIGFPPFQSSHPCSPPTLQKSL